MCTIEHSNIYIDSVSALHSNLFDEEDAWRMRKKSAEPMNGNNNANNISQ